MSCLVLRAVYSLLSLHRCELMCSVPIQMPLLTAAMAGPSSLLITQQMRLRPCTSRHWRWQLRLSFFFVCLILLDCKRFGKVSCTYYMFPQPGTKRSLTKSEQAESSTATAWLFLWRCKGWVGAYVMCFCPFLFFLFSWGFSFHSHFVQNCFTLSSPLICHQEEENCFSFTVMKSLENKIPLASLNLKRRYVGYSEQWLNSSLYRLIIFVYVNLCQVDLIRCLLACKFCENRVIVLEQKGATQRWGHGSLLRVFCSLSGNCNFASSHFFFFFYISARISAESLEIKEN